MARRRVRKNALVRALGRIAGTFVVAAVIVLGSFDFAQRIEQNVALAHELARTEHDIRALRIRRAEEMREIRRLQQPDGVVPYIYRRLRMVKPGQTLIYLVPAPSPSPQP
jgi:cell division protein FtsB